MNNKPTTISFAPAPVEPEEKQPIVRTEKEYRYRRKLRTSESPMPEVTDTDWVV